MSELSDWLDGKASVWRQEVGDDLQGGYATLGYVQAAKIERLMIPHLNPQVTPQER